MEKRSSILALISLTTCLALLYVLLPGSDLRKRAINIHRGLIDGTYCSSPSGAGLALGRVKRVLIAGHGRSGSTLTGSMFDASLWAYYFEPLKKHVLSPKIVAMLGEVPDFGASSGKCYNDTIDEPRKPRCPMTDSLTLLDYLHCRHSDAPGKALHLEVQPAMTPTTLLEQIQPSWLSPCQWGGRCTNSTRGVAAKTIRMNGNLKTLLDVADTLGDAGAVDLVIHLVRDPRAVLASRRSVLWGIPANRAYADTLEWATTMCSQTMLDYEAGRTKSNYRMLRYEDLARAGEKTVREIYDSLGMVVPVAIKRSMVWNDLVAWGKKSSGRDDENLPYNLKYGVRPQSFGDIFLKFQKHLYKNETLAVMDGCDTMLKELYPDLQQMETEAKKIHALTKKLYGER